MQLKSMSEVFKELSISEVEHEKESKSLMIKTFNLT